MIKGGDGLMHTSTTPGIWYKTYINDNAHSISMPRRVSDLLALHKNLLVACAPEGIYVLKSTYQNNCPTGVEINNHLNCLFSSNVSFYQDSYASARLLGSLNANYTYTWTFNGTAVNPTSLLDTLALYKPLSNGSFTVTVNAQGNGCPNYNDTKTFTNAQAYQPLPSNLPGTILCLGTPVILDMGAGADSYLWAILNTTGLNNPFTYIPVAPGTIQAYGQATVNGCVYQNTLVVTVTSPPNVFIDPTPACPKNMLDSMKLKAIIQGGLAPYQYAWCNGTLTYPNAELKGLTADLAFKTYTLTIIDANGCLGEDILSLNTFCDSIWPGDANNDLIANNYDILDIGLNYAYTGPVRVDNQIDWTPKYADNFTGNPVNFKINGYNIKHDDCDGNGVINAEDTLAVLQNYNAVHPVYKQLQVLQNGVPLSIQFVQSNPTNGSVVKAKVLLGSSSIPAANIYGVAFSVSIDTTMIVTGTVSCRTNNSWMKSGDPSFLHLKKELYNNERVDVALCRSTRTNISGGGEIAELEMIMKDDITGKQANTIQKPLLLNLSRILLINANGDTIAVSATGDTIAVTQEIGIGESVSNKLIKIYPNPVKDNLYLQMPNALVNQISIIAADGRVVQEERLNNTHAAYARINVSALPAGVYLIKVTSDGAVCWKRIVKAD